MGAIVSLLTRMLALLPNPATTREDHVANPYDTHRNPIANKVVQYL
jgi:hypothetical protein